jgi:para-nitrobenzyl esterase
MLLPVRLSLLLASLLFLTHCAHSTGPARATGPGPVVSTQRGPVQGVGYGDGSAAFLGIPYAAPPTGERRWRAPEPPAPWTQPREATAFGGTCPQTSMFGGKPVASTEDCLYLNVWTPSLKPQRPAPVMVWIHGGGFTMGSTSLELYDGAALAREGVVVVSMNYRLGALGFLAHPTLTAENAQPGSGNYGLMDQRLALQWVRDNVAAFGGDPNNVTLFGESAGAISVCLQMLSPQSQGLFQRVIAESGTCYLTGLPLHDPGTPAVEDSAEERGVRFAHEVGCTEGDVAACLRTKTPEQLLAASGPALDLLVPRVPFGPIVDGQVLPAAPRQLLAERKYTPVPLLLGTNADEGTLFTMKAKLDTPEQYEQAMRTRSPVHAEQLLRIYPVTAFATPRDAFNHVMRDALFLCPSRRLARTVVEHGQPVYAYHFTYAPKSFFGLFTNLGAFHAAELPFVFAAEQGVMKLGNAQERELSEKVLGYWTRFATHGNPNGEGAAEWPAYTREGEPHLVLDLKLGQGARLDQAHCDALEALGL